MNAALWRLRQTVSLACIAAICTIAPVPGAAADPFEIHAILPLTGPATFIGQGELQGLQAVEAAVNKSGGLFGRPIKFVVADDGSNPQTAVQIANGLIASKVPIVLGSGIVAVCSAIAPLFKDGPVLYCLSPGLHPPDRSFIFSTSVSTTDMIVAGIRYARARGWRRIAVITSNDASGQDADRSIDDTLASPENRSVTIVDREHFNAADLSVAAQMSRIKSAAPQLLIAWTTGTPAGTLFRAAGEAGMDVPLMTTNGNLTYGQMKQYAQFLPKELLFAGVPCVVPDQLSDRATRDAVQRYISTLAAAGVRADITQSASWDPALMVVDALRKLGPNATADQMRDYLANLKGWVGVNGPYDFRAAPQRGLSASAVVMVRWNSDKGTWVGISKPGGIPL